MKPAARAPLPAKILFALGIVLAASAAMARSWFSGNDELRALLLFSSFAGYCLLYAALLKMLPQDSWKQALGYVKKNQRFVYALIVLFAGSALVAFFSPEEFSFFDAILEDIVNETSGLPWLQLTLFIFMNNLETSFVGLFAGLLLGLPPLFTALFNGAVIGYVLALAWKVSGIADFWRLLPHGIFELPAIFISLGLGLKLGGFLFARNMRQSLHERLYYSLLVIVTIIVPLLFAAALIEGTLIVLTE